MYITTWTRNTVAILDFLFYYYSMSYRQTCANRLSWQGLISSPVFFSTLSWPVEQWMNLHTRDIDACFFYEAEVSRAVRILLSPCHRSANVVISFWFPYLDVTCWHRSVGRISSRPHTYDDTSSSIQGPTPLSPQRDAIFLMYTHRPPHKTLVHAYGNLGPDLESFISFYVSLGQLYTTELKIWVPAMRNLCTRRRQNCSVVSRQALSTLRPLR